MFLELNNLKKNNSALGDFRSIIKKKLSEEKPALRKSKTESFLKNNLVEVYPIVKISDMNDFEKKQLLAVYKQVFKNPPYEEFFTSGEVENGLNEILRKKNGKLYIAKTDGVVSGFIAGHEQDKGTYWIEELGVAPRIQRTGQGSKLMKSLSNFAIKNGYTRLRLKTSIQNSKGISFYKKNGFDLTNKTLLVPTTKTKDKLGNNIKNENGVDVRVFLEKNLNDKKLSKEIDVRFERLVVARPSGNPTLLVFDQDYRGRGVELSKEFVGKSLKDFGSESYSEEIEQGGILTTAKSSNCIGRLEMFGGEFCGNATRSAIWYFTQGNPSKGYVEVSGTDKPLAYEVKKDGNVKVEMPLNKVNKLCENEYLVELEGISHVVIIDDGKLNNKSESEFQEYAINKLKQNNLMNLSASGVSVFNVKTNESRFAVWVKEQETIFNETSCGSGTSSIGAVSSYLNKETKVIEVKQPSGEIVKTGANYDIENRNVNNLYIEGKVETIYDGKY